MKGALVTLGLFALLIIAPLRVSAGTAATASPTSDAPAPAKPAIELRVSSFPEALPNDGKSEATITVTVLGRGDGPSPTLPGDGPSPLPGLKLHAQVSSGDGMLRSADATTDAQGSASFTYRSGIMPQTGVVSIEVARDSVPAADSGDGPSPGKVGDGPSPPPSIRVSFPLAAVSYLELLLVTPAEYDKYKKRQTAAAPIYKLTVDAFPQQLAADGGSQSHLTARLNFTDGRAAPGVPLLGEVSSGDGRVTAMQKATDATGRVSFYFTAGRQPGVASVRITEPSTGLVASAAILLVQAGPARLKLSCTDPMAIETPHDGTLLPADGYTSLPLTVTVTDLAGMALSGVAVKLEILDLGCGWIEAHDTKTDAFGNLKCTYHAGGSTGKVRLRAFAAAGLPKSIL